MKVLFERGIYYGRKKSVSCHTGLSYHQRKYSESYLSSGHGPYRGYAHQRARNEPKPGTHCDPDASGRRTYCLGLLQIYDCKEITDKDINEIYQLRELLEGAAFRQIFTSGRYEEYSYRIEEKVVRMCAAAGDLYEWEIADTAMHMEIISIFDNDRINRIYENNLSELIRIGQYSIRNGMRIPRTNDNLKKMISYMRKGNYEKAFEILKNDHFGTGRNTALKMH